MNLGKQSDNQEETISIDRLYLALNDSQLRKEIFEEYKNSVQDEECDNQASLTPKDEKENRRKEAIFNSW